MLLKNIMATLFTKRTLVLIALFLLAFYLRFSFINKGPFHYDTLDLALASQKTLEKFMLHYERHGTGFPLTVLLGALSIFILKAFGATDPVFCVNFMSVAAGALGVLILFFLVERLFDFHKAMFSAILLACFAPHIAISTFGKSLTPSICCSLASAYYMVRFLEEKKNLYFIFSAVFLGFCMAVRLSDVLVILPICYLYMSAARLNYARVRLLVVYVFFVLLIGGFFYIPLLLEKGTRSFVELLVTSEQAKFLGFFSYVFPYALRWMFEIFRFSGLLLALAGFLFMVPKGYRRQRVFLYIWFLVLFLFYGNISSSGPRYLVIAWIPLLIAQGVFLGSFRTRTFILAMCTVFILSLGSLIPYTPVLDFRHRRALQIEFAQWVSQKTRPDSVIIARDEDIFLKYYGKRMTLEPPLTCDKKIMLKFFKNEIDPLFKENKKVYVISTSFLAYDRCHLLRQILFEQYRMVLIGEKNNEDWHHALLNQEMIKERLYQLTKRP